MTDQTAATSGCAISLSLPIAATVLWAVYNPLRPADWQHLSWWMCVGIVFLVSWLTSRFRQAR